MKSSTRFQPLDEFPHLTAWLERLVARPAVKRGLALGAELRKPDDGGTSTRFSSVNARASFRLATCAA